MSKVSVSKYEDSSFEIEIEGAGSLKLSREAALRLLSQLESSLDIAPTNGTFVLHLPVQYMVESAKPKEVAVYNLLKEQLTKINKGETAAMILPALTDENGNRMFTLTYVGP